MRTLRPTTVVELGEVIAAAAAQGGRLELRGGGSKADVGRPDRAATILDMSGFSGVVDYDPAELVLTVRAGTPLGEVEDLVAGEGQMLAFEPFDHGPLFGRDRGAATIGGVVAAGVAGSRCVAAGGARDHLLGFAGVSGRGEPFVAGGKVVKNVTGFDVPKVAAGSWGRLLALTEVTLKVLPAPRESLTLLAAELDPPQARAAMARALGSQAEVAAAAHLPAGTRRSESLTAFRLEGFGPSVAARALLLERLLGPDLRIDRPDPTEAEAIWRDLRTLAPLGAAAPLWRISIPARAFPSVIAAVGPADGQWLADWAGGLLWLAGDRAAGAVRAAAETAGGHAMLIRGGETLRGTMPTFQPQPAGLAALEERVRRAFDPAGVFETGRFGDSRDAD